MFSLSIIAKIEINEDKVNQPMIILKTHTILSGVRESKKSL
jgi:hypothetical protein